MKSEGNQPLFPDARPRSSGGFGRGVLAILSGLLILGTGGEARSQEKEDAAAFFKGNCMACHTIGGGRLTGPDLKDVTQKQDREWLHKFILDPQAVINSGDPYALQILEEAHGVVMPTLPTVTPEIADALLDMIEKESALGVSQFKGGMVVLTPFTAEDLQEGRAIFEGVRPLANGGTSCASCHAAPGLSALGGGSLGPDLTRVADRLGGRAGLAGWLQAPATPTMRAAFKDHPLEADEIQALGALFDDASTRPEQSEPTGGQLAFLGLGLGLAVVMLLGLEYAYRNRLRGVRGDMVESEKY